MPWKECSVMDERMQFVARRLAGEQMAELCREFGISRKTGLKSAFEEVSMRLESGMRFDQCIGLQDRDALDGRVFDANVLTCHDKPLSAGENIRVGGRAY